MNIKTAAKVINEHEAIVALCTYNILLTNDICCGLVIDAAEAMKHTPYFRHEFKRHLNEACNARREYERIVNTIVGTDRDDFFADCNDRYTDGINRHVDTLYWQFKQCLDDNEVAYSAQLAKFELARTLCEYSCRLFDYRMEELKSRDKRFAGFTVEYIKLSNVSRQMNLASDSLNIGKPINMNTEKCNAAFSVLIKELANAHRIADSIQVKKPENLF